MAPRRDQYFDGDREPAAGEPRTSSGSNMLTQKLGPLPVWGWAVAGVAIVFFLRRNSAAQPAASTDPSLDPYSAAGGGVGGVFLLPGSTASSPATPAPAPTPAPAGPTPDQVAFMQWVAQYSPTYPGGQAALTRDLSYIGSLSPAQQAQLAQIGAARG